ncbi:MAG: beta-phosphoglucomutase [Acidimicrobiales bacterium]
MQAAIFDLDGVLVDTAKYHYLAWKRLADQLHIEFSPEDNERLKGVSRGRSLEIILELGGIERDESEKAELAAQKNSWYLEYIDQITPAEILPDVVPLLISLRAHGIRLALASASKNATTIVENLGVAPLFDGVVDGNAVSQAKPDPEVFLAAAALLDADPGYCVVFEDAVAGVEAGKRAGMFVVGVGAPEVLGQADIVVRDFTQFEAALLTREASVNGLFIEDAGYDPEQVELNGSRFLLSNGYMGYRGTLDEYGRDQQVACTLAGLYDQVGGAWREPVNAPNGLLTVLYVDGEPVSVLTAPPAAHRQLIDMRRALHERESVFELDGGAVVVRSRRFLSQDNVHVAAVEYRFSSGRTSNVVVETGIDGDVWDINGPHLHDLKASQEGDCLLMTAVTSEGARVGVAETTDLRGDASVVTAESRIVRRVELTAPAGQEVCFHKYVAVYTDHDDVGDVGAAALDAVEGARSAGYDRLEARHAHVWYGRWQRSDVEVEGDNEAQLALRYSLFQLMQSAPSHTEHASIPGRGLSGQMYKGATFWDTEVFMLPFFIYTQPKIARKLLKYRCHALDAARRKAAEYGYKGAYYAWESQDNGEDACTLFNITDVFTNRPLRTYFRDKQIHISADVAYAIWQYYMVTGDETILRDGGADVILECARFYCSWAYFKKDKNRFELLDVTGPDEYHERVSNDAFTNGMVRHCLRLAIQVLALLRERDEEYYARLLERLNLAGDLRPLAEMADLLYVPEPDEATLIVEQFDGYHKLEDVSVDELKSRVQVPTEYLGGGNGLATTTKVLKQADVVALLTLFRADYTAEVKRANWDYYDQRTEQGSTLSASLYAMLAADVGLSDRAYDYFMSTATVDLTGNYKRYVGDLYIGGTHPGANGGAWMTVVHGFAGLQFDGKTITVIPALPSHWERVSFNVVVRQQSFRVEVGRHEVRVTAGVDNTQAMDFAVGGTIVRCTHSAPIVVAVRPAA